MIDISDYRYFLCAMCNRKLNIIHYKMDCDCGIGALCLDCWLDHCYDCEIADKEYERETKEN